MRKSLKRDLDFGKTIKKNEAELGCGDLSRWPQNEVFKG